jgi:hypothetical protein
MEKCNVGTYLAARQRKLRRDLSDMVLSLHTYDESHTEMPTLLQKRQKNIIPRIAKKRRMQQHLPRWSGKKIQYVSILPSVQIYSKWSLRSVLNAILLPFSVKCLQFFERAMILILSTETISEAVQS